MKTIKPLTWYILFWLAMSLTSALVFFYIKTQEYGKTNYFMSVALLSKIKQRDAQWELDAMRSKIGINKNYDPLVNPILDFSQLDEQLAAMLTEKNIQANILIKKAIQEKAGLIEQFKSHNAVLRNSLVFLPKAAEDVQQTLHRTKPNNSVLFNQVSEKVRALLLASLVYEQAATEERATEIQSELQLLVTEKSKLPAESGDRVNIFASHVRTILREYKVVNELLQHIAALPVATRVDMLHNILNSEQIQTEKKSEQYRLYLLFFAAILISVVLLTAVQLIRSRNTINRINKELQLANNHLEYRVEQRTRELKEAQHALVSTARIAGMAEIATNVLHNVGNVLNSVNVSAGLISNQMRTSKSQGLGKAMQMINEHAADLGDFLTNDPKGRMLPDYLNKLASALTAEQQSVMEELAQLTSSVDHIKEIIATQQSFAGASGVIEQVSMSELLDDAVRMSSQALQRHHVEVKKDYTEAPSMLLDRHKVLLILVNLISNAKYAMHGVTDRQYQITLRLHITEEKRLKVQVEDNGIGIAAENLTRIFEHGFTTRKDGHGFGLHSCVLAAKELGGSLTVHSDGIDKGTTFTLELPIKMKEDHDERVDEPAHSADR